METQSVFLPSYSIGGSDVYKKVPDICRPYGTKAIVIGGEKAMAAAKEDLLAGVAGSDIEITGFLKYGDDVTYEAADALCANPDVQAADMIFAVGGGPRDRHLQDGGRQARQTDLHLPDDRFQLRGGHPCLCPCTSQTAASLLPLS